MTRTKRYVSATELAALGYCEIKSVLDRRHGEVVSSRQQERREEGRRSHAHFDRVVSVEHNKPAAPVSDPRCFIATVVYGAIDPRTDELRRFRDRTLLTRWWGRAAVQLYYATSPTIARALRSRPACTAHVRRMLDVVRRITTPRNGEHHGHEHP